LKRMKIGRGERERRLADGKVDHSKEGLRNESTRKTKRSCRKVAYRASLRGKRKSVAYIRKV